MGLRRPRWHGREMFVFDPPDWWIPFVSSLLVYLILPRHSLSDVSNNIPPPYSLRRRDRAIDKRNGERTRKQNKNTGVCLCVICYRFDVAFEWIKKKEEGNNRRRKDASSCSFIASAPPPPVLSMVLNIYRVMVGRLAYFIELLFWRMANRKQQENGRTVSLWNWPQRR